MRKVLSGILFVFIFLAASNVRLNADQTFTELNSATIPTRTPTASPVEPTNEPSNPPPSNPNPPPTNTATAVPTATPIILPPTPEGGYLATAEPCAQQPTVFGLNPNFINVRTGPGTDYDIMGQLIYAEVRPIIGRAGDTAWWQIQMPDGLSGWVADEVVQVDGNPTGVPIVAAPPLAGVTVTQGAPWQPTPPVACPTETATAVPEATSTEEIQVVEPLATISDPTIEPSASAIPTEIISSPTPTLTATPIILPTAVDAPPPNTGSTGGSTSVLSGNSAPGSGFDASNFLLFGAALMAILGTAAFVFMRRTA